MDILPYVCLVGAPIGLAALTVVTRTQDRTLMGKVARRIGGSVHTGLLSSRVHWEVEGLVAQSDGITFAHFAWPCPGQITATTGLRDGGVRLGHVRFDRMFRTTGGPHPWLRVTLNRAVRKTLLSLHALGAPAGAFHEARELHFEANAKGVTIRVRNPSQRGARDRLRFVELLDELFRGLLLGDRERRAPIAVGEARDSGCCPICSDEAKADLKPCGSCQTTYHAECWDWIGGCAVIGCAEYYKGSAAPKPTPPKQGWLKAPPPAQGWLQAPPSQDA